MFDRSRRNLAYWFTLSMGSIVLVFASVIYYQQVVERLQQSDRQLYRKASLMAANIDYARHDGEDLPDLSNVPILGNYAPPVDNNLVYARWYSASGKLHQFYGPQPSDRIRSTAAFETIEDRAQLLRQLTLPVDYNGRTIRLPPDCHSVDGRSRRT
jgi:hypothetical protein